MTRYPNGIIRTQPPPDPHPRPDFAYPEVREVGTGSGWTSVAAVTSAWLRRFDRDQVGNRLELLDRVQRRTHRRVRLPLDHDLHQHRQLGGLGLQGGPAQRVGDLAGLLHPTGRAAERLHELDVVDAALAVVQVDRVVHVVAELGLPD